MDTYSVRNSSQDSYSDTSVKQKLESFSEYSVRPKDYDQSLEFSDKPSPCEKTAQDQSEPTEDDMHYKELLASLKKES